MIKIRKAKPNDAQIILDFVHEIAEYEKLSHEVENNLDQINKHFFSPHPKVFALIIEQNQKPIGYAVYFYNYSTFTGKHGLYLEDFYLQEAFRRGGIGKMVFDNLINICNEEDLTRMEWVVLDWNKPAINFYKKYEPRSMDEWILMRLNEKQLRAFKNQS